MPLDRALLEQALRMPEDADPRRSPLVSAIILRDPANAADLVPYLETEGVASTNASRILALFGADAVPHLIASLADRGPVARMDALQALWSMMIGESPFDVREALAASQNGIEVLLADKRPLPDRMPAYVERDFRGRVCDLAFVVIRLLIEPEFDLSLFRSLDETGRDREIARLRQRGMRPMV